MPAWPNLDADENAQPIPIGDLDCEGTLDRRRWKQLESTTTWPAMGAVIGTLWDDVEVVLEQLEPEQYVGTAQGVFLDEIGQTIDRPRGGQSLDVDYRLAIIGDALSMVTDGSPDQIIDVAIRLAPDGSVVIYDEPGPASLQLTVSDLDADRFALLLEIMGDMAPAGVGAFLVTYDTELVAGWGYDADPPAVFGSWSYSGGGTDDVLSLWSYAAPLGG